MTPDLAEASVLVCDATRPVTPPSPDSDLDTKWNWSEAPLMSLPPPLTVHVPLPVFNDWLPAGVGPPMSAPVHPAAELSVHITRVRFDWKLPTVVTDATTTSSPAFPE